MSAFFQTVSGCLIAVVLSIVLSRQGKDMTLLLGIAVCCMVLCIALRYLEPVIEFIQKLRQIGELDNQMLTVMLKAVGIGVVAEIAGLICTDAGSGAIGKTIQIMASAVILSLSVPLMTSLIELIQKIVGEV